MDPLVADIASCFPVNPVPAARDAIIDTYMVEHLHEILGDKPWPSLSPIECRHCSDGFTFLTPIGLHYYLPAYMTAEVVDAEEADVVIDSLIGLFQRDRFYRDDRYLEFWNLVTDDQLAIIGHWVDHYETTYDFNDCTQSEVTIARTWLATLSDARHSKNDG
ncbi:hypothetical protein CA13_09460 [Planctomycetes bacterium CA13]|uniref:Uncharacterized protein n=1 Tax=Novipirellula herctigrandis TaxID=2527986 RepID=A0A5C5YX03_9BACT|nr:hypothetical protein CA13_09460 [Planctomycetes bacterium CA13]